MTNILTGQSIKNIIASKLSRSVGMLSKLRHYIPHNVLRSVYFAIFASVINYGSIVWGQHSTNNIKRLENIQNKAVRTINFADVNAPTNILYRNNRILKFKDHVKVQNLLLVHDDMHKQIPYALQNTFNPLSNKQNYQTRGVTNFKMCLPKIKKVTYGEFSISYQAAKMWNDMVSKYPYEKLNEKSRSSFKIFITNMFLDTYT